MLKKTILATLIGSTLLASSASFADNRKLGARLPPRRGRERPVVQHYPRYDTSGPPPGGRVQRPVYVQRPGRYMRTATTAWPSWRRVLGGAIAYQIATH